MIYEKALAEKQRIEEQIQNLEMQLQSYPEGNIFIIRNGKYFKWYQSKEKEEIYIPKSERKLAEQLAAKKYLSYLVEELKQEQKAIDFYLKHHKINANRAVKLLTEQSEYQELLSPFFKPISQELIDWKNADYEHNMSYTEQLIQRASEGKMVRSKSEVLIDMVLYKNKIPFRYECALKLNGITIYPDFTIRHPKTGEVYYWEHFGKADDPTYNKSIPLKLQNYITNGIIPSHQLITTYETRKKPLNLDTIEKIVEEYFL